ncbi:hypothetical protein BFW38_06540 [Terasakiispira papahanaumokuakeensis]|uniref:Uncharacterized protein n=1 Tax=Terasakiispira papahanaumokuakeensis TaxID=197479 RepID=A0A1E2V8Q3_9GAMM|nr:hypothetical protein BFW38_06540 [Terasakiispira papahanaumokuakeensis]
MRPCHIHLNINHTKIDICSTIQPLVSLLTSAVTLGERKCTQSMHTINADASIQTNQNEQQDPVTTYKVQNKIKTSKPIITGASASLITTQINI